MCQSPYNRFITRFIKEHDAWSSGVPEDKTAYYAEAVRQGGTLVLVRLAEEQVDEAMAIMERHQAVDIEQRAEKWRAGGWTQLKKAAEPY